jgi:hypothetical protein
MGDDLKRNLGRLGAQATANHADRALRKSCIGRIVSLLTLFFILACGGMYALTAFALYRSGLGDVFPDAVGSVLAVGFFVGLIGAVVVAGLIGNWLRRRIWQMVLRRRR